MRTARLVAQTWLTTAGAVAQAVAVATFNTCALVAIALDPPKQPRAKREAPVPQEGTWWERSLGIKHDDRG